MSLVAIGFLLALAPAQKTTEVWRWRLALQGSTVEIYDSMKGNEKVGTGLRRVVNISKDGKVRYENLLKPEWESVIVVKSKAIFVRKKGEYFLPLYAVPFTTDKERIRVEKPVPTPYRNIYSHFMDYETGGLRLDDLNRMNRPGMLMGLRKMINSDRSYPDAGRIQLQLPYQDTQIKDWDVLDDDFNVKFTVSNVRGFPRRYGSVWMVPIDTNEFSPLTLFLNEEGEQVSPEIPLIKEFNRDGNTVYAIPTSLDFDRFIPILPDGRIRHEPIPTGGYYPGLAFQSKKGYYHYMVDNWVKEYLTPEGPRYGWASLDLKQESGPLWRSINWWNHSFNPVYQGSAIMAQMNDGSWMIYDAIPSGTGGIPHRPFLPRTYPTQQEAIDAFAPIYRREVAEPALARQREERKQAAVAFEEMSKYLGVDPSMSTGGVSEGAFRSDLYRTVTMLNARLYREFDEAWPKLPGDYRLKYMAIAYQLRRYGLDESTARQYAASAVNPGVKATFEGIASRIKSDQESEAKRKQEAEEARKRELSDPNRFKARPPSGSSGWASPWTNPYAQPSFAESSKRHEAYMSQMWKYLGGQSAWRPY